MLPRVILHSAVSLDGKIDGFPVDLNQNYELATTWKEDATLAGSDMEQLKGEVVWLRYEVLSTTGH
jgi:hypothetical protein